MAYTFHWGSYPHPACEVYPRRISINPVRTEDSNARWGTHYLMEVAGDLVNVNTPQEVLDAIALLDAAYQNDFQDCGFKLDGVKTPHWLLTNDVLNLTGNRVIRRSWDNVLPTELANTRSFSILIEAVFSTANNGLISFQEQTTKRGTGGPRWELYETFNGDPVREPITTKSKVFHETHGRFVTIEPWVGPPAPYWPSEERTWDRILRYSNPKTFGHPSGKFTHYAVDYSYFFERVGPYYQPPGVGYFIPYPMRGFFVQ